MLRVGFVWVITAHSPMWHAGCPHCLYASCLDLCEGGMSSVSKHDLLHFVCQRNGWGPLIWLAREEVNESRRP